MITKEPGEKEIQKLTVPVNIRSGRVAFYYEQ